MIGFAAAVVLYLQRIVDFGFDIGLGVREVSVERGLLPRLAPTVLTGRLALAAVLATALGLGAYWLLPAPENAVVTAYGLTLLTAAASTRWIHLGLERTGRVAAARMLGEALMVTGVLVFVHAPADIGWMPAAQFAGDALAALLLLFGLRAMGYVFRLRFDWSVLRPLLPRAWPLMASGLLGLVIYNSDLVFLRAFHGTAAVGYYAAAYTLVSFLLNMGTAYNLSLLPTLTRLGSGTPAQHALYHTSAAQVFAVAMPIAVGGFVLADPIIGLVFGARYPTSGPILALLIWSVPLLLVRSVPVVGLMAHGREDDVLRLTAWAAAGNLALNVMLIPTWGVLGAAASTVVTEVIRLALAAWYARRLGFSLTGLRRFWRAGLACGVMGAALALTPAGVPVWVRVPAGAALYGGVLFTLGGLRVRGRALPELTV